MKLTDQEVSTVLVALRNLQGDMLNQAQGGYDVIRHYREMGYYDTEEPLNIEGIDDLCMKINEGSEFYEDDDQLSGGIRRTAVEMARGRWQSLYRWYRSYVRVLRG